MRLIPVLTALFASMFPFQALHAQAPPATANQFQVLPQTQASATAALPTPPEKIGPYTRTASEDLGPLGGMLHRYAGGTSGSISVFIFWAPPDVKEGTSDARTWTNREAAKFPELLAVQKEQRSLQDFSVPIARRESVTVGAAVIPGHFTVALTRGPGRNGVEMVFLYCVNGVFLKVRASLPIDSYRTADAPGFAEAIVMAVAKGK